jgi:site-specific recombinase XerD
VRGFLQQLFSNSVDGRSVARKLSALRHLYRFLLLDKRVDRDPTLNIPLPKQWKILPKALGRDEIEKMPSLRHRSKQAPPVPVKRDHTHNHSHSATAPCSKCSTPAHCEFPKSHR